MERKKNLADFEKNALLSWLLLLYFSSLKVNLYSNHVHTKIP